MSVTKPNEDSCPQPEVLAEYLQGRLQPPTLEQCESHVADCLDCHETLRGLDGRDTLTDYVASALDESSQQLARPSENDENHLNGLVDRLLRQTSANGNAKRSASPGLSPAEAEQLADRAAEVLRCVTPEEDGQSLGLLGDYRLVRLLGAGSTGVVFQAVDQTLDRVVALKVLRPSLGSVARERFIAEARLAASIEHPNVVTIYQIGAEDRLAFIAMQWLPGQTLEAKLLDSATMPEGEIRDIARQIAAGLQSAHQRQLVHRDIKPANIWICETSGEVKILDFGLARIVDEDPGLTATGMLAGTPNFMSPEQTKGLELDGRSDLFSLGCVLYRMSTSKFPFGAATILGTLQAIQHEQPQPPKSTNPRLSADLSDLTMALLEKQPVNRPASAEQVAAMLDSPRDQWPVSIAAYESPEAQSSLASDAKTKRQSSLFRWTTALALSLLGFAAFWLSPQIIRIATDKGELVIESNDADVEVQVLQNGEVVRILDTKTKGSFDIRSGKYQLKVAGGKNSFDVQPASLMMKRGEKQIVKVMKSEQVDALSETDQQDVSPAKPFDPNLTPEVAKLVEKLTTRGKIGSLRQISARIERFKKELVEVASILGPDHPSVKPIQNQINALMYIYAKRGKAAIRLAATDNATRATNSSKLNLKSSEALSETTSDELHARAIKAKVLDLEIAALELEHRYGKNHPSTQKAQRQIEHFQQALGNISNSKPDAEKTQTATPTFKGQPFAHWIHTATRDRSSETVCDALTAANQLADTSQQHQQVMEITRSLARKHGTFIVGNNAESDRYTRTLAKVLHSKSPDEQIDFVIQEISEGSQKSAEFCVVLIAQSVYEIEQSGYEFAGHSPTQQEQAEMKKAVAVRSSELINIIIANLNRSDSHLRLISSLESGLLPNTWANGQSLSSTRYATNVANAVRRVKELNPKFALSLRHAVLGTKTSLSDRIALAYLAILFNPENLEIRTRLEAALLTQEVEPVSRDQLLRQLVSYNETLKIAPLSEQVQKQFMTTLAKLIANQTGDKKQRAAFSAFETIAIEAQPEDQYSLDLSKRTNREVSWWRYAKAIKQRPSSRGDYTIAHATGTGTGNSWLKSDQVTTIDGPAAAIWHSLMHAYDLQHTPEDDPNGLTDPLVEPKLMRPFLEAVIALETSDDKALVEDLKTLHVFKNARWMLEHGQERANEPAIEGKQDESQKGEPLIDAGER